MSTVCTLAVVGTFSAASAQQLFVVWIGYSLLLAGRLYDQYADYSAALLVAAMTGLFSAGIAFYSFKPSD